MNKSELKGYMEFNSFLPQDQLSFGVKELLDAMERTQIHAFGWPIGVVMHTEQHRPRPFQDGGRAKVEGQVLDEGTRDYWVVRRNGEFFLLKTLFEDQRKTRVIFLDTRVVRTAEVFLRTARLYETLGVPLEHLMSCRIEYGGLKDRLLSMANPMGRFQDSRRCSEDRIEVTIHRPIGEILQAPGLKDVVYQVVLRLGEMCDFFTPDKGSVVDSRVDEFLRGRIV
jgi:hypothetical protein